MERRRRPPPVHGAALDRARRCRAGAPAGAAARRAADSRWREPCSATRPSSRSRTGSSRWRRWYSSPPGSVRAGRFHSRPQVRRSHRSSPPTGRRGIPRSRTCPASRSIRRAAAGPTRSSSTPERCSCCCRSRCSACSRSGPGCRPCSASSIATNAVFYTFYEHTHLHPRFLYASLPALFVLEVAGGWLVIRKGSGKGRIPWL